ncbi:hypothetical protein QFZ64_002431 [Streptomyces sp. B3I8]|nr:hypothetical protein [Streptomyces sp. B3I8]
MAGIPSVPAVRSLSASSSAAAHEGTRAVVLAVTPVPAVAAVPAPAATVAVPSSTAAAPTPAVAAVDSPTAAAVPTPTAAPVPRFGRTGGSDGPGGSLPASSRSGRGSQSTPVKNGCVCGDGNRSSAWESASGSAGRPAPGPRAKRASARTRSASAEACRC